MRWCPFNKQSVAAVVFNIHSLRDGFEDTQECDENGKVPATYFHLLRSAYSKNKRAQMLDGIIIYEDEEDNDSTIQTHPEYDSCTGNNFLTYIQTLVDLQISFSCCNVPPLLYAFAAEFLSLPLVAVVNEHHHSS
ncbi:hypothetical protein Tco_1463959 [Tanacetum coccineum]